MITFSLFAIAFFLLIFVIYTIEENHDFLGPIAAGAMIVCLIAGIMRCCAHSDTAITMWNHDDRCLTIKNALINIKDNIREYDIKEDYSTSQWRRGNVVITHKSTGTVHKMWIGDDEGDSYIHWYQNGKLVLRNGYKNKRIGEFAEEYYPLVNSWYTSEAINDYIFKLVEEIIKAKRVSDTLSNEYCNTDLLSGNTPSTKTLEVTAPVDTTITAEVSQNNNIIHQEQI